jgi:hypothetical protein
MKINEKILQLVKNGLKATMITTLSESQINTLHRRLVESKVNEQVTQIPGKPQFKVGPDGGNLPANPKGYDIKQNTDKTVTAIPMGENQEVDEKFESKKQQKYFFAKCGEGKTKEQKKWCKMADEFAKKTNFEKLPEKKTETNEDEGTPVYQKTAENLYAKTLTNVSKSTVPGFTLPTNESKLEKKITQLVEKHISPKMSKQDFINTIKNIMVESPKKFSVVKRNLKSPIMKLPIMGLNEDDEENGLPDWLTSKSIGI